MTVLRGQIYQFNLNPVIFFSVQRVYSPNQILIMNVDTHAQVYFTETKLLTTCTLMPFLPKNRIYNGYDELAGTSGVSLAATWTIPFFSGSLQAHGAVTHPKGFAPTYLRSKGHGYSDVIHAGLINPLVLGGYLAGQGRVVQAQADQG